MTPLPFMLSAEVVADRAGLRSNGGPVYMSGRGGGNNFPRKPHLTALQLFFNPKCITVRGGKASNFEGGIRVNGFVSGGCLPKSRRGIKLDGLVTGWDWCKRQREILLQVARKLCLANSTVMMRADATFVHGIGGLDATDKEAAAAGLPAIDSVDQWSYLSGKTDTAPRTTLAIGSTGNPVRGWLAALGGSLRPRICSDRP